MQATQSTRLRPRRARLSWSLRGYAVLLTVLRMLDAIEAMVRHRRPLLPDEKARIVMGVCAVKKLCRLDDG